MNTLVVYESVYGNTRAIAEAIAEGLGGAPVVPVSRAEVADGTELLVVGGPTHMHGLATARSRQMGAEAAHEDAVQDSEGPLEDGELDRARAWGAELVRTVGLPAGASS
jgi:Flavodoxin domain